MLTHAQRVLRARIGALALHASHDAHLTTVAARAAFRSKFEIEVDPDGTLPEAERLRRAEYARKAHFAKMALKSARARSKRSSATPTTSA